MEWQAAPLFATPVFKLPISGVQATRKIFEDQLKDTQDKEIKDQQGALSHFHSRENVFERLPALGDLGDRLQKAGDFVYRDLLNYSDSGPLKITNAWFNLCDIGGAQPMHNHVNCLLCGTLYIHADEHTRLQFEHPQSSPSQHAELYDSPANTQNKHGLKFHQRVAQIPVSTGDCLFWPSRLRHGYKDNKTPGRLTLSFNMIPTVLNAGYQTHIETMN